MECEESVMLFRCCLQQQKAPRGKPMRDQNADWPSKGKQKKYRNNQEQWEQRDRRDESKEWDEREWEEEIEREGKGSSKVHKRKEQNKANLLRCELAVWLLFYFWNTLWEWHPLVTLSTQQVRWFVLSLLEWVRVSASAFESKWCSACYSMLVVSCVMFTLYLVSHFLTCVDVISC